MEHAFSSGITQVTASKSFLPLGMSVAAVFKVPLPCCDIQLHVIAVHGAFVWSGCLGCLGVSIGPFFVGVA